MFADEEEAAGAGGLAQDAFVAGGFAGCVVLAFRGIGAIAFGRVKEQRGKGAGGVGTGGGRGWYSQGDAGSQTGGDAEETATGALGGHG